MTKRRTMIALLALVALVVGLLVSTRTREPSYDGRKLSEWLEIHLADEATGLPPQNGTAANAVQEIGTNGLPFLLEWIRYEPSPWQRQLGRAIDKGLGPPGFNRLTVSQRQMKRAFAARMGFEILGPTARPALPELLKMVNDTNSPVTAFHAFGALASLGEDAIRPVAEALTNANHPMHRLGPWAVFSMTYLGTNAAPLVPLLVKGTLDTNDNFAEGSVQSLGSLRLMPEISVPALINSLNHSNPRIRRWAAENLRRFSSDARAAVTALIAARSDPDYLVRESVERALTEIAPEVLTNAPPR